MFISPYCIKNFREKQGQSSLPKLARRERKSLILKKNFAILIGVLFDIIFPMTNKETSQRNTLLLNMLKTLSSIFFLLCIFFSFSSAHAQGMELTLRTSEDIVTKGQSFSLILTAKSKSQEQISLSGIRIEGIQNFQEKGIKNATQMSIINGRVATVFDQQRTLVPLKEGLFQLTAYAGNDKSNTLTITVQSAQAKAASLTKKEEKSLPKKEQERGTEIVFSGLFWWILGGIFFSFGLTLFFLLKKPHL